MSQWQKAVYLVKVTMPICSKTFPNVAEAGWPGRWVDNRRRCGMTLGCSNAIHAAVWCTAILAATHWIGFPIYFLDTTQMSTCWKDALGDVMLVCRKGPGWWCARVLKLSHVGLFRWFQCVLAGFSQKISPVLSKDVSIPLRIQWIVGGMLKVSFYPIGSATYIFVSNCLWMYLPFRYLNILNESLKLDLFLESEIPFYMTMA